MKKVLGAVLAAFLLVTTVSVQAADLKIGIVNVQKIMHNSKQFNEQRNSVMNKFAARKAKLVALQKSVKTDMEKLERDSAIMSDSEKTSLRNKVIKQRRKLQTSGQDFSQDFQVAERAAMKKFYEKLETAIKTVAERDKYDVILQKRATSYSNEHADITDSVLKILG